MYNEPMYLLMQPEVRNSYWIDNIRAGICSATRKSQNASCVLDSSRMEATDLGGRHVLVIGNHTGWLESALAGLTARGALPIIVNACMLPLRQYRYSGVVFELEEMLDQCLAQLSASGRTKTALLGVDTGSAADRVKADAFARPSSTIWSDGQLELCVSSFIDSLADTGYDSVICANDTVAVCLISQLTALGVSLPDRLYCIGMGNSHVGAALKLPLTSVMFDYRRMGEAAVRLYHSLTSEPAEGHMTISLPCRLIVRESAPIGMAQPPRSIPGTLPEPHRAYFDGDVVQNIIRIEAMLQACDAVDREIILGSARGETCEAIAERLFFSDRAVRYRIARIVKRYGFASRADLESSVRSAIYRT